MDLGNQNQMEQQILKILLGHAFASTKAIDL